ncbi:MAG: Rrf2 family transcriptional regulator [Planctomycetota bacterium]|nr:Rrf2 family transcriptional regulator [Planctomycetota bacterium]
MQLTVYTDYALRTLLYLGLHPDRPVPAPEVAQAYAISVHHVAKVAKALVRDGFVRARRGRAGGLELAVAPDALRVGDVVRRTEPTLDLLECFDRRASACPITGACRLEHVLHDARAAFLEVLDRTTLADLLTNRPALARRLGRPLPASRQAK